MEEFEVNHLSLDKIDTLRLPLAAITGRHKAYPLRIYKSGKVPNENITSNILLNENITRCKQHLTR
jgi:hypothetical protein